ncbi:MAG: rubrerythrin family protein [Lachnospiraceae bacterium]|nr:rubrerythrin family protein [Lachnospiraceae bacterium]
MDNRNNFIANSCSMEGIRPIMMDLPYPPIQVMRRNPQYADLLLVDYCGSVSELSAILQYINNENRMSGEHCSLIRTILGIAMAEMIHLQKLGELIHLLGGTVSYQTKQPNGLWSPACLTLPDCIPKMLQADLEAENAAIRQYRMHIQAIQDPYVNAVLKRIIQDEEYHIMILQSLMNHG